ncbi:DNA-processing protein DprA [Ancrocorticia sp.]
MHTLSERDAAMAWTRITEAEDVQASKLIAKLGYHGALEWLVKVKTTEVSGEYQGASKRWKARLDEFAFERDRRGLDQISGGFLMPDDPLWPSGLSDWGPRTPLGLWFRGNIEALSAPCIAIVGTRDPSQYGTRIATDFAYELTSLGVAVVSGGAFGIDAAAHKGALTAAGQTIVVLAGGVDRPYPAHNASLFSSILESGGLLVSEVPLGASPHRHRFLARNRIIAGMTRATIVVEAPFRSGAINTARHALEIGHEVGAIPGPINSARSAGCHRLLRENATCVTTVAEAVELLGYTPIRGGVQTELDVAERAGGRPQSPLSLRVQDALPVSRPASVQKIAATAGLSIQETMRGLGSLEMEGRARSTEGKWQLAKTRA